MEDVFVYNALNKSVHVQAFGNHFNLKPKEIKLFRGEIAGFILKEKGYLGLVDLPSEFSDPSFKASEEGARILAEKTEQGINNRVQHLQRQVYNLQVSLKTDLNMKEMNIDPLTLATDGDIAAMSELKDYQRQGEDEAKARLDAARKLERELKASQTSSLINAKKD